MKSEMLYINKKKSTLRNLHSLVCFTILNCLYQQHRKGSYSEYVKKNYIKCYVFGRLNLTNYSKFSGIYVNYSEKATTAS